MYIDFKFFAPKFKKFVHDMGKNGRNLVEELKDDPGIEHVVISDENISENLLCLLSLNGTTHVKALTLEVTKICADGVKFLAEVLKGSNITYLKLEFCYIESTTIKYLAEILKDTCLTYLHFSNYAFEYEDVKYLAEGLKHTGIISLDVSETSIASDDVKCLADALKDTSIINLAIGVPYLGCDGTIDYLAKALKRSRIISLNLRASDIHEEGILPLADVLKYTCITELDISHNLIGEDGIKYLAERLKDTKINCLSVECTDMGFEGMKYLADILQDTGITEIDCADNNLSDDAIKYLAERLKNTNIITLLVARNGIISGDLDSLTSVLKETSITCLDLSGDYSFDRVSDEEVKYLAKNLQGTCITDLNLSYNKFSEDATKYLLQSLKYTQITQLTWKEEEYFESEVTSKNKALARKIQEVFQKLVAESTQNENLEFILPNDIHTLDFGEYLYIVKTINDCPSVKVHILNMVRKHEFGTYPNIIRKINEFVITISDKFNNFFNNNLTHLMNLLNNFNYTDLVQKCEYMELHDIVKNLLLHRELFYVDDDKEILHPYIYKMLKKYDMTVLNEYIESNKKNKIISYYQSHKDIDGAQEIINLLESYPGHDNMIN